MRSLFTMALSAAVVLGAGTANAAVIFAPVSGVIDDGGPGFGTLDETINQAGLFSTYVSGVTDFDAYVATNPIHSLVFSGNEWFSNLGTTSAVVTYDLGAVRGIDRLALWNEEVSGIGRLNLLSSTDGLSFSALATGLTPVDVVGDYPVQVFSFAATSARYVRFEMSECPQPNPGTFGACAIGEVAFRAADVDVPEPTVLVLLGAGLVGAARRRFHRR